MKRTAAIVNLIVLLFILAQKVYSEKIYNIYDFPPLYKFDDYDACLSQKHDNSTSIFAMVFAEIKPNNSSEMWQQIQQHSLGHKFRYRHDRLFFGVCLEKCKHLMKSAENLKLQDDDLIKNEITDYFEIVHKRPVDIHCREEHHVLIHNCLNQEFHEKYDLNLKTFIEYCEEPENLENPENVDIVKDPLESLLYKTIGIIVILNILSSIYDFWLKRQQPEGEQTYEFYKINPQQTVSRFLTSFSICRNYYRLIQPYFGEIGKDFQFLDGYRSFCMLCALYGHTFFLEYQHIANPQYFELSAKNENSSWHLNTTTNIEIYFVMSGLLLFIKFQQGNFITPQTSWKKLIATYIKFMTFRYIRFFPSLALLILANSTILHRLQNGPFWRHTAEPVRVFSRERGWRNLLMINNFQHKESASHHTWYLAADWQLFAFYLLIIMIVSKYPKYKKLIYTSLAILSFVIPFSISYMLKLQPCFIIKPETLRYSFFDNIDVYYEIYIHFYTNLFGYLMGIICAEIYLKYTHKQEVRKIITKHHLSKIAFFAAPVIAFLIFWSGAMLHLREPSIWSALYAATHRNLWIIFMCAIPTILMSWNYGGIVYEFWSHPIFRILARLSFQVYIWHMTIIYMINSYQRQPYYVNNFYFFTQFLTTYSASNILAFFLVIFVEYPLAQSLQILQSLKSTKAIKKS